MIYLKRQYYEKCCETTPFIITLLLVSGLILCINARTLLMQYLGGSLFALGGLLGIDAYYKKSTKEYYNDIIKQKDNVIKTLRILNKETSALNKNMTKKMSAEVQTEISKGNDNIRKELDFSENLTY